jgi:hypothetical protein
MNRVEEYSVNKIVREGYTVNIIHENENTRKIFTRRFVFPL